MPQAIFSELQSAAQQLTSVSDVPVLEAEILLAHILHVPRSYIYTWPEKILEGVQQEKFLTLVARRLQGEPIAYIVGKREFWSLELEITKDTLIPRPETELLVDLVLEKIKKETAIIADLGTGSGAIALAIASERKKWRLHATDVSNPALLVAKRNATRLNFSDIVFHSGHWCKALPTIQFDAIISNPPYIAEEETHLMEASTAHEPRLALVSGKDGLNAIREIILEAKNYLVPGGFLLIEHGFQQAEEVTRIFQKADYTDITVHQDLFGLDRVTLARLTIASS